MSTTECIAYPWLTLINSAWIEAHARLSIPIDQMYLHTVWIHMDGHVRVLNIKCLTEGAVSQKCTVGLTLEERGQDAGCYKYQFPWSDGCPAAAAKMKHLLKNVIYIIYIYICKICCCCCCSVELKRLYSTSTTTELDGQMLYVDSDGATPLHCRGAASPTIFPNKVHELGYALQ